MEFDKIDQPKAPLLQLPVAGFDRVIEVDFDEHSNNDDELKAVGLKFLEKGYRYILSVLGNDALIGMKNIVKLKNKGRHMTEGVYISLNILDIENAEKDSSGENSELQQSLVVHEILHHLVEEEHLPMFLEIIYMREKGQNGRIENIKMLYQTGRLSTPYILGLRKISEWLGCSDIESALSDLQNRDIAQLKEIFKMRYEAYCEEDPALAQQIAGFSERIKRAA